MPARPVWTSGTPPFSPCAQFAPSAQSAGAAGAAPSATAAAPSVGATLAGWAGGLGKALLAFALALLCGLQGWALWRAPAAWFPAEISVRLAPGESATLGRAELAAPQAEQRHIALRRDGQGAWWLRNVSTSRQVLLQGGQTGDGANGERRLRSQALLEGQNFQIGRHLFGVQAAKGGSIAFSDSQGQAWFYDGAVLRRDGAPQPPCPDAALHSRAAARWNQAAPASLRMGQAIVFGGNLLCGNRLGLPDVAPGAATLANNDGTPTLAPGNPEGGRQRVALQGADLRQQELPLAGVASMVVGRTQFRLSMQGDTLLLQPGRRVALFAAPEALFAAPEAQFAAPEALFAAPEALFAAPEAQFAAPEAQFAVFGAQTARPATQVPEPLQWRWQQRDLWQFQWGKPVMAVLCIGSLALVAFGCRWLFGWWPFHTARRRSGGAWRLPLACLGALLVALLGMAALVLPRLGSPLGAGFPVLLSCTALWCWLLLPALAGIGGGGNGGRNGECDGERDGERDGRPDGERDRRSCGGLSATALLGAVLLAVGLLAQLEQGLGGMESHWLRYHYKSAALLTCALGLATLLRLWLAHAPTARPPSQREAEWGLAALFVAALLGMALEVVFGDESGVFDIQPVELTKLALVALSAHALALRIEWRRTAADARRWWGLWLRMAWPVPLFLAMLCTALVQVSDYSPLVLLLVWGGGLALAYALAARSRMALATLLALAGLGLALMGQLRGAEVAAGVDVGQSGFYADRFSVWRAPDLHPHSGEQFLLGAQAIADGGWLGADGRLGFSSLGQPAGAALQVPAVQDDFAASFFLHRHGLAAGLALWLLQAAFVSGLLLTAWRAHAWGNRSANFRQAWLGRFACFALAGGAAFTLGHFMLSWGTNLGMFPVMGQPMSFLSAGGSHLMFFLCPLLAFHAGVEAAIAAPQTRHVASS